MARARGRAEEGRRRQLSGRARRRAASCGWRIRTASRRTCGRRACPTSSIPTSASSTSIRSRRTPTRCARRRCLLRDMLAELGMHELGEDVGVEGISRRVRARRQSPTAGRSRASRTRSAARSCGAIRIISRRSSTRPIAAARFSSTPARNEFGATFAAAYAVRPKPGAPVSAPCTWEEVESGAAGPRTFTLRTMAERLDARGDLWSEIFQARASLPTAP